MFSLKSRHPGSISRAAEHREIQVSEGSAVVWLKGRVAPGQRETMIETLLQDSAITNVLFNPQNANKLHLSFRYDEVNYQHLLDEVSEVHNDAVVMGI